MQSVLKKQEGRAEVDMARIYHILCTIVDKEVKVLKKSVEEEKRIYILN